MRKKLFIGLWIFLVIKLALTQDLTNEERIMTYGSPTFSFPSGFSISSSDGSSFSKIAQGLIATPSLLYGLVAEQDGNSFIIYGDILTIHGQIIGNFVRYNKASDQWQKIGAGVGVTGGPIVQAHIINENTALFFGSFTEKKENSGVSLKSVAFCDLNTGICSSLASGIDNYHSIFYPSISIINGSIYILYPTTPFYEANSIDASSFELRIWNGVNWNLNYSGMSIQSIFKFGNQLYGICKGDCELQTYQCPDQGSGKLALYQSVQNCWSILNSSLIFDRIIDGIEGEDVLYLIYQHQINFDTFYGIISYDGTSWKNLTYNLNLTLITSGRDSIFFTNGYLFVFEFQSKIGYTLNVRNNSEIWVPFISVCDESRPIPNQLELILSNITKLFTVNNNQIIEICRDVASIRLIFYEISNTSQYTISSSIDSLLTQAPFLNNILGIGGAILVDGAINLVDNIPVPSGAAMWDGKRWRPIEYDCENCQQYYRSYILDQESIYSAYFEFPYLRLATLSQSLRIVPQYSIVIEEDICYIQLLVDSVNIYALTRNCTSSTTDGVQILSWNKEQKTWSQKRNLDVNAVESTPLCSYFPGILQVRVFDGIFYFGGCFNLSVGNFNYSNIAKYDFKNNQWLYVEPIITSNFGVFSIELAGDIVYVGGTFNQVGSRTGIGNVVGLNATTGTFVTEMAGGVDGTFVVNDLKHDRVNNLLNLNYIDFNCEIRSYISYSQTGCLKLIQYDINTGFFGSPLSLQSTTLVRMMPGSFFPNNSKKSNLVAIVVPIVVVVIILSAVVLGFLLWRRRNKKRMDSINLKSLESEPEDYLKDIEIFERLGGGNFGDVYKGRWQNSVDVALKSLKDEAQIREFVREASILKSLSFPQIVQYLGLWKHPEQKTIYIVMEYMSHGSLDRFLQMQKGELGLRELLIMCKDAAAGMNFLESKKIIHRDLALRNLLLINVDGKFRVKISDFGMSRFIEHDYYKTSDRVFAIKWAAPEVLEYGRFSSKSDVWSFGVVMWEIFSYGKLPYHEFSNSEAAKKVLEEHYQLPKPVDCPDMLYELMQACWNFEPNDRPSFRQLILALEKAYKTFIISNSTQENPTNFVFEEEDHYMTN